MAMYKTVAIPLLVVIILASAAGGGWFLWQRQHAGNTSEQKATQGKQLYTCSMHPFIIKDKPGTCPICGMELIKKIDNAPADDAGHTAEQKQVGQMLDKSPCLPTSESWQMLPRSRPDNRHSTKR